MKQQSCQTFILNLRIKLFLATVTDWNRMGRDITQTHGRAFQTLDRAFQTLGRAFSFRLNTQKLGQVF